MAYEYCDAPVAQLDRAAGFEPVGRGFKSLRARQRFQDTSTPNLLFCLPGLLSSSIGWRTPVNGGNIKKGTRRDNEMRAHCDFTGGIHGKYARRYTEGTTVVILDPDVARMFPNREAVNETLRAVAQIVQIQERRRATLGNRCTRPRPCSGSKRTWKIAFWRRVARPISKER